MINKRSLIKVVILFLFATACGFGITVGLRKWHIAKLSSTSFVPLPITFESKPPTSSLTGMIATSSADVRQGDVMLTDATSSATIIFENLGQVNLGPNASLTLSSTMPGKFLFWQKGGIVTYNLPTSVRSQHALVQIASGSAIITFESSRYLNIEVASGSASIAYQDLEQNTLIKPLLEGEHNVYDDLRRTLKYKR